MRATVPHRGREDPPCASCMQDEEGSATVWHKSRKAGKGGHRVHVRIEAQGRRMLVAENVGKSR